jgi:hypothetical protein
MSYLLIDRVALYVKVPAGIAMMVAPNTRHLKAELEEDI